MLLTAEEAMATHVGTSSPDAFGNDEGDAGTNAQDDDSEIDADSVFASLKSLRNQDDDED